MSVKLVFSGKVLLDNINEELLIELCAFVKAVARTRFKTCAVTFLKISYVKPVWLLNEKVTFWKRFTDFFFFEKAMFSYTYSLEHAINTRRGVSLK